MAYEPLHHKYRPQTFAELVGQDAIATTLSNAISSGRIAPAYLFTGPRGTGKTSSARILAKSLNCIAGDRPTPTPCGQCDVCRSITRDSALDVVEIDAASNTGVDNIRETIERAQFAPAQCRYKVYVIDECHMLSTPAFNALLKTLEEPPARVVFVLATTDPQKVLATIISRCQRFDFRRIPLESMTTHLQTIAAAEKINIDGEAIALVAQIANGGLRDAESLLDQLSLLSGTVTVERVWDLVGAVPERDLLALVRAIAADNSVAVIEQCRHLMDRGREPLIVLQNLASFYLYLLIAKTAPQRPDLAAVTETIWQQLCQEVGRWQTAQILQGQQHLKNSEVQLKNSTQPRLWLEVTLLGLLPSALATPAVPPQQTAGVKPSPCPPKIVQPPQPQKSEPTPPPPQPQPTPVQEQKPSLPNSPAPASNANVLQSRINQTWERVLEILPPLSQALVRQHCYLLGFDLESSVADVGVRNKNLFKIAQSKKEDIETALTQVWQQKVTVNLQVGRAAAAAQPQSSPQKTGSDRLSESGQLAEARRKLQKSAEKEEVIANNAPPSAAIPKEARKHPEIVPNHNPDPVAAPPQPPVETNGDRAENAVNLEVQPPPSDSEISNKAVPIAAQHLAQQFDGAIIALEDDFFAIAQPTPTEEPPPPPDEPKLEVDEEIPF